MRIVPQNASLVAQALQSQIENDQYVKASSGPPSIERCADVDNPSRFPLVSVFRMAQRFPTRILGMGSGFRSQEIDFAVVCAESDATSGEQCEERLEALVAVVVGAVLSDTTIGGTVQVIDSMNVQYDDYRKKDDQFVQAAAIIFTAKTVVTIEQ